MSQFDHLRNQITDSGWIAKEILSISGSARGAIEGGANWYFALPHINFIMENSILGNVKQLLLAGQNLAKTVTDCGLVFLETVYGINLAFNSKVHRNLAGTGQSLLLGLTVSGTERILYAAAVSAHNESINLPELDAKGVEIRSMAAGIQSGEESAISQAQKAAQSALNKLIGFKDDLLGQLANLTGKERSSARRKIRIAEKAISRVSKGVSVIAHNPYEISSIYDKPITSISTRSPVFNAIVPIAVGGAVTVAATAGIIGTMAGWLLTNFFLQGVVGGIAALIPALTNTITSIVLKVMNSSGADAMRFLAGSVLRAGSSFLPTILATTGMEASAWGYLMANASLIIGVSVIIIQAMKNKVSLADMLYIFGNIQGSTSYNLGQIHMYDTNHVEILEQFKESANIIYEGSKRPMSSIIGVGLDKKGKYTVAYNLTNPNNPQRIIGDEAIVATLGAEKVAKLKTGNFGLFE
ncbi:hypothetical protein [Microcoleus sp. bin38.metabat.b11b12b14.051]|uniref:hypothetical protein n=1 Tax=Microcoleus sp. bin38.metabat.b11b12b14.051 TaxID=2742709 RepID=UPI0025EEDC6A|nr:hypothetical protein [Microcoleus sp. bin38.metabat.b11b12b14.051]